METLLSLKSNSDSFLIIFSAHKRKFMLNRFMPNNNKIYIRDRSDNYYFTNNKKKIFNGIKNIVNGKKVKIIGVSKSGYVSLELAKFLTDNEKTYVDVYLFNPMIILDKSVVNNVGPNSLLRFVRKTSVDIECSMNLFENKKYNLYYTYSSKSIFDKKNYDLFKNNIDFLIEIRITSHNCLFPFVKKPDKNSEINHYDLTIGNYIDNDLKEIEKIFRFSYKEGTSILNLKNLLFNQELLLENNFLKVFDKN